MTTSWEDISTASKIRDIIERIATQVVEYQYTQRLATVDSITENVVGFHFPEDPTNIITVTCGAIVPTAIGQSVRVQIYQGRFYSIVEVIGASAITDATPDTLAQVTGLTLSTTNSTLHAEWSAVPNTYRYEIQFATDSGFTQDLFGFYVSALLTTTGQIAAVTWFVRVRAVSLFDVNVVGPWSAIQSILVEELTIPNQTDGFPPASSPACTITEGIGYLLAEWDSVANADEVTYEVHISTQSGFTPSAGTLLGETHSNFYFCKTLPNGTPLQYEVTYYVRLVAKDYDGAAGPGAQGAGAPQLVQSEDVGDIFPPGYISDGLVPAAAPTNVTASNGMGQIYVTWTAVNNLDPVMYDVHISSSGAGFVPDANTLLFSTPSNFAFVQTVGPGAGGGPLVYGTTYYIKIVPRDQDGYGPASSAASGQSLQVTTADVVNYAVTSDKLAANSVLADKLMTGAVTGSKIYDGAVTATKIFDGAIIASKVGFTVGGGNQFQNSDFESSSGLTPWFLSQGGSGAGLAQVGQNPSPPSANSARLTMGSGYSFLNHDSMPLRGTEKVTISIDCFCTSAQGVRIIIRPNAGTAYVTHAGLLSVPANTRTRVSVTLAADSLSATSCQVSIGWEGGEAPQGRQMFFDRAQFEWGEIRTAWAPKPDEILPGTIGTTLIADDAITTQKILAGAITAGKIAANTITADQIATNAITTDELAAGAVYTENLYSGAVTAEKIAANTITANEIASNAITADEISAGAIGADELAANSVVAGKVAAGAIAVENLVVGVLTDNMIPNGDMEDHAATWPSLPKNWTTAWEGSAGSWYGEGSDISGSWKLANYHTDATGDTSAASPAFMVTPGEEIYVDVLANQYNAGPRLYVRVAFGTTDNFSRGSLVAGVPTAYDVAVEDMNGTVVQNIGTVGGWAGAVDMVGGYQLPAGYTWYRVRGRVKVPTGATWCRVGLYSYGSGSGYDLYDRCRARRAVGSASILDASIVTAKIADLAVGTAKIADLAVSTAKIADAQITTAKIVDLNVTRGKIALLAVDTAQINDAAIATAKIGDLQVTTAKIGLLAVDTAQIKDAAITTLKVLDNAIVAGKLSAGAVTTEKLTVASLSESFIPNGTFEDIAQADSGKPASWTNSYWQGNGCSWGRDTGSPISGAASLYLTAATQNDGQTLAPGASGQLMGFGCEPGATYSASALVRASRAVAGQKAILIAVFSTTLAKLGAIFDPDCSWVTVGSCSPTTSIQKIEGLVTAPANMPWCTLAIRIDPSQDGYGWTCWWDQVMFRKAAGTAYIENAAITNAKINDCSVAKLTAGTIGADVIVGGYIRTATSGSRVEMNSSGIKVINGSTTVVDLNANGSASFQGSISSSSYSGGTISGTTADLQNILKLHVGYAGSEGMGSAPLFLYAASGGNGSDHNGSAIKIRSYPSGPGGEDLYCLIDNWGGSYYWYINSGSGYLLQMKHYWDGATGTGFHQGNFDVSGAIMADVLTSRAGGGGGIRMRGSASVFSADWTSPTLRFYVDSSNVKNFVIDHPVLKKKDTNYLVHACLEGPEAAVFYRGEVQLQRGIAVVKLPDYFTDLCDETTATVQLTPVIKPCQCDRTAPVNPACTPIVNGEFTIMAAGGYVHDDAWVYWRVEATRKDVPQFEVEPSKAEYAVGGDGPYTYLVRK